MSLFKLPVCILLCCFLLLKFIESKKEVCVKGYIMDTYCIERGNLLDNPSVKTLEHPEKHSVHCLVDVGRCYNSGFEVLALPPNSNTNIYCRAIKLDETGNEIAHQLGRDMGAAGSGCTTCTGTKGSLEKGFRATVIGTIDETKTSFPREIITEQVLPFEVDCPSNISVTDPCTLTSADSTQIITNGWVLAHGTLMITSWGFLLPSGVLIAHFLRHRDPKWFLLHRAIQLTGICLAISGFIIAISNFSVFEPGYYSVAAAHGYMGCVVTVIGFLQPINAYFRPHVEKNQPKSNKRTYWEYWHKGSGWLAIVLSIPTIIIGTTLAGPNPSIAFQMVYAIFIIILLALIFFMFKDKKKLDDEMKTQHFQMN